LAYINQRWALDLVKFPESHKGNLYALTFIEYCSRYACAFPIREATAHNIANIFLNEILFKFGFCRELLSDRGSNLAGEVMKEVCKILKINRLLTSSQHPQSDGLLEKFHSTLATNIYSISMTNTKTGTYIFQQFVMHITQLLA
jgi:transposase InsO family protein